MTNRKPFLELPTPHTARSFEPLEAVLREQDVRELRNQYEAKIAELEKRHVDLLSAETWENTEAFKDILNTERIENSRLACRVAELENNRSENYWGRRYNEAVKERDEALARVAELEEIPESIRHSEMVKGLESVIRGLETRAENAEFALSRAADLKEHLESVRKLRAELSDQEGGPDPWDSELIEALQNLTRGMESRAKKALDTVETNYAISEASKLRERITELEAELKLAKNELAARRASDEDVMTVAVCHAASYPGAIVAERLLSAPWFKKGGEG